MCMYLQRRYFLTISTAALVLSPLFLLSCPVVCLLSCACVRLLGVVHLSDVADLIYLLSIYASSAPHRHTALITTLQHAQRHQHKHQHQHTHKHKHSTTTNTTDTQAQAQTHTPPHSEPSSSPLSNALFTACCHFHDLREVAPHVQAYYSHALTRMRSAAAVDANADTSSTAISSPPSTETSAPAPAPAASAVLPEDTVAARQAMRQRASIERCLTHLLRLLHHSKLLWITTNKRD